MTSQHIAIIGAGNMGRGLVQRLTAAGHEVLLADRHPERADTLAAEAASTPGSARSVSLDEAVGADIIIIALWFPASTEFATANAEALAGKIVVDISNPLDGTFTRVDLPGDSSGAEKLAAALPASRVVKAFNTLPAPTLQAGVVGTTTLDVFVASDDADARATVIGTLGGTGLRVIDAGKLDNSRLLERLTAFALELGQRYGLGFDVGFKFLPITDIQAVPAGENPAS